MDPPLSSCAEAYLADDLHLAIEASGATFNQGHVGSQAHLVHVATRLEVVQRVENDAERLEPRDVEFVVLDVGVVRLDVDVRVESASRFLCDLRHPLARLQHACMRPCRVPVLLTF